MNLGQGLKNIFNNVAGSLPVIGPHQDIEVELMLAGKKPLTCLLLYPKDQPPPPNRIYYDAIERLNEAVKQGKLNSHDILIHRNGHEPETVRYYCQLGKEKEMMQVVADNEQFHNGKNPDVGLDKDIGTYFGYRKRDIWLWSKAYNKLASDNSVSRFINFVNRNITQPAYQGKLLHSIEKDQKKADKAQRKNDKHKPKQ